ncbi:MAG: hypothetical protein QM658_08260 [Gordonia sp. (in: high G+C Gram-positive bacteria)]
MRRILDQAPRNDATTIMGMQTRGAAVFAASMVIVCTVLSYLAGGVEQPWVFAVSAALLALSATTLLMAPGDPMVWPATLITAAAPLLALIIAIPALAERPGMAYATLTGLMVMVQSFMCVRGRPWAAWTGYAGFVVIALTADHLAGPLPALTSPITSNFAVMLMATFFAAIVRPRARQIYALRRRTELQTAAEAAEQAMLAVRDDQIARLDDRARPLLERIAEGGPFDESTMQEFGLVGEQLRDRIRAPGLDGEELAAAVWAARARGVRVVLLDDLQRTGSPQAGSPSYAGVGEKAIEVLSAVEHGSEVTVRLLPAGRAEAAMITVAQGRRIRRLEFGDDGALQVDGVLDL